MKFIETEWNAGAWPTQEEFLEVNARSIISDCRALISGTLVPRSLGNIQSTWHEYEPLQVRMRDPNADAKIQRNKQRKTDAQTRARRIDKFASMLVLDGMDPVEALERATQFIDRDRGEK